MTRACIINDHSSFHQPSLSISFSTLNFMNTMMYERYVQSLGRNYSNNGSGNHSTNPNCNSDDDFGTIFRTAINN